MQDTRSYATLGTPYALQDRPRMPIFQRAFSILLVACLLAGCGGRRLDGPQPAPNLDVSVSLAPDAQRYLDSIGERVLVVVYFDGDSKLGPSGHNAPFRAVYLGSD